MSREKSIIHKTGTEPITPSSLAKDLKALGVKKGMTLIVHSSLSAMGWVCGGAQGVIEALTTVLSEEGTLVMPAHTTGISDPIYWENPPVPPTWIEIIRRETPAYKKDLTSTRGMGIIAESFRKMDGVCRSNHPLYSFSAWGKHSQWVTGDSLIEDVMGDGSPLGKIYKLGGYVLLLGVGYDSNTSIHLSEHRNDFPGKKYVTQCAPCMVNGKKEWVTWQEPEYDTAHYPELGKAFEKKGTCTRGKVGLAASRLMAQRDIVDFAGKWIMENLKD